MLALGFSDNKKNIKYLRPNPLKCLDEIKESRREIKVKGERTGTEG